MMRKTLPVLILYFLISGSVLLVSPWTDLWPKVTALPAWLAFVFSNPVFKGLTSGLGLVLILAGLLEIRAKMKEQT